ncbi:MAG: S-formylglutathione hydrolase [Janthinobacterium lividum]
MLELISEHLSCGGVQRFYRHTSVTLGLPARFGVFLPPAALPHTAALAAATQRVPALFYLAGLTCTDETFAMKAGAQRYAAQHGIALVTPDTSPRGAGMPHEADAWDFGVGAGFYLDATQAPWASHYRMYSYIVDELRQTIERELPIDGARLGVFGHSMGGHGALVLGLRRPDLFRSVSAFAPIAAPSDCPWGQKAFTGYLGADRSAWASYDASALVSGSSMPRSREILIDQGLADPFLAEQLLPERFETACAAVGQTLNLRRHAGYDHSYYFISSFIADHLAHHARALV